jgi:hypothetical protein
MRRNETDVKRWLPLGAMAAILLAVAPAAWAQQGTPTAQTTRTPAATGTAARTTATTTTTALPRPSGTPQSQPTGRPGQFADPAFRRTWERTDLLVADGRIARSWYWGPRPNTGALQEDYAEGPGGKHLVQYFDKSRMEINNPAADPNNPFFVTNGLLAQELISGRVQVGNTQFTDRYPAEIPLASDTDDTQAPTYASYRSAVAITATNRVNSTANTRIDRTGVITTDASFDTFTVKYAFYEQATRHNIPDVFWQFLNESGPIVRADGEVRHARLSDPYFYVTGYPVSEAYWARVKIENRPNTPVLIQAYERRVLTYVPSAPTGFKVQMGNIGLHYYDWRYRDAGRPLDTGLACGSVLNRGAGIGRVWYDSAAARGQLGCPTERDRPINIALQEFERGRMVSVVLPGPAETLQKTIYVLYNDGSAERYPDTYVDGSPEPTAIEGPPVGFVAPVRGFGKLWNENPGVRQRLGWGASGEQTYSNSLYAPFERGVAFLPNSGRNDLYVLFGSSTFNVNRWMVYPAGAR